MALVDVIIGYAKGAQGDVGPQGPQGEIGPAGPQGPLPTLVNNALTTEAGVAALDAAMGKTLQDQITEQNSNLNNKANTSDIIDKVRLTGTVTTTVDANSPLGYSGTADITALSGYPAGKEIMSRTPFTAYSSTMSGLIYFSTSTMVTVTAKSAATYTYIIDLLYKRG